MFHATLTDPKLLRSSIDAVSNMIDEANLSVGPDGIRLRAMDPAHVALVDFEMKKEAFERYEVEGVLTLGLDLERFNTILKRASASDPITLELKEKKNTLKILFQSEGRERRFEMPLIEVSEEELKTPNLTFSSEVEIDPKILSEGIKDAEVVSDHVILMVDPEFFILAGKGDLGNVEVKVAKEEAIAFECREEARAMFSIEYLKDMVKASDISNTVKISLGNNIPVQMDFLTPNGRLSFLLAPRIESE
jgi:proliferating cell nuclear antigen